MNNTKSNEAFQYFSGAAKLRILMAPWLEDQSFINSKNKILYAVDTNTIVLFSNPFIKDRALIGLPGDNKEIYEILAWALGRYIFYKLTFDQPLLVIPPINLEIDRVFSAVMIGALKETIDTQRKWPKLNTYLNEYTKTQDEEAFIAKLENESIDLISFVFGGRIGKTAELERISELLRDGRVLNIEAYVDNSGDGAPWYPPLLRDKIDKEDYNILNDLTSSWQTRLKKTASKKKKKKNVSDDAEMLARLEWMNKEIREDNRRLVLITDDLSVQNASVGYMVDEKHSFADLYIRDPNIFLAAPDFLKQDYGDKIETSDSKNPGLIGWLEVFLGRYDPNDLDYLKQLRRVSKFSDQQRKNVAAQVLEQNPNYVSEIKTKWKEFIRASSVEYTFESGHNVLANIIETITGEGIESIKKRVEQRASEVTRNFWQAATVAGYWSTDKKQHQTVQLHDVYNTKQIPPKRGVPALRFTLEKVHTRSNRLSRTLAHQEILQGASLFDELKDEDSSGYTAYLLYALAFGALGRWGVIPPLSEYALFLADHVADKNSTPEGYEQITGNEAAYLLAWGIRHKVRTMVQLEQARTNIKEAKSRKAKATGGDGSDIRYETELIALYMTYHCYRLFWQGPFPSDIPSLKQIHDDIIALLQKLSLNKEKEDEHISVAVEKQLLAYLFCSLLLRQFKEEEADIEKEVRETIKFLPQFKTILENKDYCTITCFTQPIYLIAGLIYGTGDEQQKCVSAIKKLLSPEKIHNFYLMPYDEALFDFFKNLVTRCLNDGLVQN